MRWRFFSAVALLVYSSQFFIRPINCFCAILVTLGSFVNELRALNRDALWLVRFWGMYYSPIVESRSTRVFERQPFFYNWEKRNLNFDFKFLISKKQNLNMKFQFSIYKKNEKFDTNFQYFQYFQYSILNFQFHGKWKLKFWCQFNACTWVPFRCLPVFVRSRLSLSYMYRKWKTFEKSKSGDSKPFRTSDFFYEWRAISTRPRECISWNQSVKELVSLSINEAPGFDKVTVRILKHAQLTSYDCCHSSHVTCDYSFQLNTFQE